MLRVEGVTKRYGEVIALDHVDLEIERGEVCGLLGPNGAGKSTLVSIIAGLKRPDAGRVEVDGIDVVRSPSAARRRVGIAPQEPGVYATTTVRDNLRFFGELADLRGSRARGRIESIADQLALTDLLDRKGRELSGGERRRLHTAMAMLHRPPVLLLDEPTAGVDVATRAQLLEAVKAIAAEGTAVCYSTHYLHEVEVLDASVAIIDGGRMIARGAARDLVAAHATCVLDLTFDGSAPAIDVGLPVETSGSSLRLRTDGSATVLPTVIAALGADGDRLTGVEILRPNLESVFLTLTGRRFEETETDGRDRDRHAESRGVTGPDLAEVV